MADNTTTLLALDLLPGTSQRKAREMVEQDQVPRSATFLEFYAQAEEMLQKHWQRNIQILSYFEDGYPAQLRNLRAPPNILYVRGDAKILTDENMVAVVGTRQPSTFGVSATEAVVRALAQAGLATVSGLALGIDTICHKTSLEGGVPTVAILGSGLDAITPAQNRGLAEEIIARGGAVISELPLGTQVRSYQLVARNRLQTGLSQAVIIGQTPLKSGTMHTARFAVETGRPIWCPRPHETSKASEGLIALLDSPGRELPEILPAFADTSAKWREEFLSDAPLAQEITREGLPALIAALRG